MCFIYKRNPESQQNYNRKINFTKTDLMLETHHQGTVGKGEGQRGMESRVVREEDAHQSCVGPGKRRRHTSTMITEPSYRKVRDKSLVHNHIPIARLIQSSQFLWRLTQGIRLSSSILSVRVWSREGKRCDSGHGGKQVRQGSRVPIVRGGGWVLVVNRTVPYP